MKNRKPAANRDAVINKFVLKANNYRLLAACFWLLAFFLSRVEIYNFIDYIVSKMAY
ncbi:MAG: hypothetical protein IPN36_02250 [Bacteroidetes bacterium]|nr:hypothetical protein [Bacteroidota bacterium]